MKNPSANAGDIRDEGLIPELGRSPGGRHSNSLQYTCLENPHRQRSLIGYVHGVTKSQTRLRDLAQHPSVLALERSSSRSRGAMATLEYVMVCGLWLSLHRQSSELLLTCCLCVRNGCPCLAQMPLMSESALSLTVSLFPQPLLFPHHVELCCRAGRSHADSWSVSRASCSSLAAASGQGCL